MYSYSSHNGTIVSSSDLTMPVGNIEYMYGFGVYETIRVSKNITYFVRQHIERLWLSANTIQLQHQFTTEQVERWLNDLIEKNEMESGNCKIILVGAPQPQDAQLYILCLPPLYPEKKWYTQGASAYTAVYERYLPQAKTLNMLPSYLLYEEAKRRGCYDALLVDHNGNIREGTRSNFFAMRGNTIYTPPAEDVLLGITREHVLHVAKRNGFTLVEEVIPRDALPTYDAVFLTGTSIKILPLSQIDSNRFSITEPLHTLMKQFKQFLSVSDGLF